MPTYDYQCESCGYNFEAFQGISDGPLKKCPVCGGLVKRLISKGAGLIFKGSGFYITDYRKGGSKQSDTKKESSGKKDGKSEGSSGKANEQKGATEASPKTDSGKGNSDNKE